MEYTVMGIQYINVLLVSLLICIYQKREMDLYGDLLKEKDTETIGTQQPLLGNSWMSLKTKPQNKTKAGKSETLFNAPPKDNVEATISSSANSMMKFMPSSVLFKPRQTSTVLTAPISSKLAGHAAIGSEDAQDRMQNNALEVEVVKSQQKANNNVMHEKDELHSSNNTEREVFVFNANSSFEVDDPYDPRRPNDYFTVCKQREERKRKRQLAEENSRRMEENERIRADIERQRREAIEKQDFKALTENTTNASATMPGGRGRGLSNLPAWLVQKMQQDKGELPPSGASAEGSQFSD